MMRKASLLLLALIMMAGVALAEPAGEAVFHMEDPMGDSFGPGNYTYPQHSSFPPELPQMLDLVGFTVSNTEDATRFEFEFAQTPNLHQPWGGAGFNFHRIDLYIASGANGSAETFRPGARVQFHKPWQVNLRIRDWKGGYLIHWQDDDPDDPQAGIWQDQVEGFDIFVEGKSIVAEISHNLLGPALPQWKYYVLVGLQDAYGPDQYREITEEGGPWTGGGGTEAQFNPNLYDILAAGDSQSSQLKWDVGKLAQLQPVGPGTVGSGFYKIFIIAAVILVAAGAAVIIWMYRK
jgi:carbohydrate-binding DOMON domain-containing protein